MFRILQIKETVQTWFKVFLKLQKSGTVQARLKVYNTTEKRHSSNKPYFEQFKQDWTFGTVQTRDKVQTRLNVYNTTGKRHSSIKMSCLEQFKQDWMFRPVHHR